MKLVTAAEMRSLEEAAFAAGASPAALMEEAGLAVAQEAWMMLGTLEGRRIAVLCGPGNNGGDGLVAARHLLDWGASVAAYLTSTAREPGRAAEVAERGGMVISGADDHGAVQLADILATVDLVIDAVLGIGAARAIDPASTVGTALAALGAARRGIAPPRLIAVDVPTGLDPDTGAVDPLLVAPDLTVTFGLPKVGMYQAPGSGAVGRVQVIDLGFPAAATGTVALELMTARWAKSAFPARPEDGNKGTFGRVLVVGGSRRYAGAPRLAALGAYRAGAGLVTVACPAGLTSTLAAALAEATWLPQEEHDGALADSAALALRREWAGFDTAVVGPGMGASDATRAFLWAALPDMAADLERGVVLDADALNALAQLPDGAARLPGRSVLTPHPGELARLLGSSVAAIQAERLAAAREAAGRFGAVVVLKGAHTLVAAPGGAVALSPFANPLLATAGSGDVLAGMIGAYLGQGLEPFVAAALGVYVHGASGEALRSDFGDAGLLAGEIAGRVPSVARDLKA